MSRPALTCCGGGHRCWCGEPATVIEPYDMVDTDLDRYYCDEHYEEVE